MRCAAIAVLMSVILSTVAATEQELPAMMSVPHDTVFLSDNSPIFGTIIEIEDDGSIIFDELGKGRITLKPAQVLRYEYKRTVVDIVEQRSAILLGADEPNEGAILLTLKWALEQAAEAQAESQEKVGTDAGSAAAAEAVAIFDTTRTMARDAALAFPDNERIVTQAVDILRREGADVADLEKVLRVVLQHTPGYDKGYELLVGLLRGRGAPTTEIYPLVETWVEHCRSSVAGNRALAEMAEQRGAITQARDSYSRLYATTKDPAAGVGYVRTSFLLGSDEMALDAARELIAAGHRSSDCLAIAGSILLRRREPAEARTMLEEAVAEGVSTVLEPTVVYNLGLARYRQGDRTGALEMWRRHDEPMYRLARAHLARQPFADVDQLPASLRPMIEELNACLLLEHRDAGKARRLLDPRQDLRHRFLVAVAEVLERNGRRPEVERLTSYQGVESLRWQLYGHIRGQRFDEAQRIADELPADDGYAAVCRVYLAALRMEEEEARELYRAARQSRNPPAGYLARIAAEYEVEDDVYITHDFAEWAEGYSLRAGWHAVATGTGIDILIADNALHLRGTQTASSTPVNRVWSAVAAERLRAVTATLDLSAVGQARVGLELFAADGDSGVAYGVLADGTLAWRQWTDGAWSVWQRLDRRAEGTTVDLRLRVDARYNRVSAVLDRPVPIGANLDLGGGTGDLRYGVFGFAEPGEQWDMAVQRIVVQSRAEGGEQSSGRRRRAR